MIRVTFGEQHYHEAPLFTQFFPTSTTAEIHLRFPYQHSKVQIVTEMQLMEFYEINRHVCCG
jgi:hypothetical protein